MTDPTIPAPVLRAETLTKQFGAITALDNVTCAIEGQSIFGLIGSNGAGKSTFLRIAAGVYQPSAGRMLYRDRVIYDDPAIKEAILFVADQPYFPFDTLNKMANLYRSLYRAWNPDLYEELLRIFPLNADDRLDRMSKGMRRQAAVLLAIAAMPKLLLLDEAFDGLDPVMRQNLKRVLARQVTDHEMTVIIASQNLRELEDFCDHVGLLHEGGLLFVEELDELRLSIVKAQVAFPEPIDVETLRAQGLNVLNHRVRGSVLEILARNNEADLRRIVGQYHPLLVDVLPLSLEEVFIYELAQKSYVTSDLLA